MSTYFQSGGKVNSNMLEGLGNDSELSFLRNLSHIAKQGALKTPYSLTNNFVFRDYNTAKTSGRPLSITVGEINASDSISQIGGIAVVQDQDAANPHKSIAHVITITENQQYLYTVNDTGDAVFKEDFLAYPIRTGIDSVQTWDPPREDDVNLSLTNSYNGNPYANNLYLRNSGNVNVPVYVGDNYVWIKYIEAVDQINYSTQTVSNVQYETLFKPGYCIRVTNAAKAFTFENNQVVEGTLLFSTMNAAGYICLGSVNVRAVDGDSINYNFTYSYDSKQYGYLSAECMGTELTGVPLTSYTYTDPASSTDSVAANYVNIADHINAIGTGNISARNPHGLSAADLGLYINDITTPRTFYFAATTGNTTLNLNLDPSAYRYILIDTSAANATILLPDASYDLAQLIYTIKNAYGSGTVTIQTATGNKVNRAASHYVLNAGDKATLMIGQTVANGDYNTWYTIG